MPGRGGSAVDRLLAGAPLRRLNGCSLPACMHCTRKEYNIAMNTIEMLLITTFIILTPVLLLCVARDR